MTKPRGRFFYITGCDGTGKTTQARLLLAHLQSTGVRVKHLWLRFPFMLSIPLLVYARLRGFSWHEDLGSTRYGYWNFKRSWLLRNILPWLVLIDAVFASIYRVYIPLWLGYSIVCERYVLDMLVDLAVGLDDLELFRKLPGKLFVHLVPSNALIVILDLDAEQIRQRRSDLIADRSLSPRLAAYQKLYQGLSLCTLSSAEPIEQVNWTVRKMAGI